MTKVRERAGVVCVHQDKLLCVRLEDPVTKVTRLFPPGGGIEPGEAPIAAAVRETLEETGCEVIAEALSELVVQYPFHWAGTLYQCTTHFFRATFCKCRSTAIRDADFHRGVVWVPSEEWDQAFQYDSKIYDAIVRLSLPK